MVGDQRFVIRTSIIGVVRREKPTLKTFMVSVLWSDESEVIIHRSFQDFRAFHGNLKKKFPNFNPFKKNDRMIPKFTGKARRSSLQQKGSRKSVRQMTFLESYCDRLLKCEQTVTLSSEVARFFTPRDNDLQTNFPKNTVMIMKSDDVQDGRGREAASLRQEGNVTHPFVTQTYRCVAPYETKDTKNRPFKVAADEKLDVLIKDPAGWWLVESEDKRLAWFPAPYLELSEGEGPEDDEDGFLAGSLYCAVRSYSTTKRDEVSVSIGCVVEVLRKSDDGWWFIRFNGRAGFIPAMYLQPYTNPRLAPHGLRRHLHGSSLNLASSRESRSSNPESVSEDSRRRPARLLRAQSLDVLSETWPQAQADQDTSQFDSRDSIFSSFFSSSGSSSRLRDEERDEERDKERDKERDEARDEAGQAEHPVSRGSRSSTGSSGSSSSAAPRVPQRPKTQEILTRCSTMTRKAALATQRRVQV